MTKDDFFVFEAFPVRVRPEKVLRQLGYPPEKSISLKMQQTLEAEIAETLPAIAAKGAYLKRTCAELQGFELFAGAEIVVLALATIGSAVEQKAKALIEQGQPARAFIVDAIGTVAVEDAANFVERQIRQESAVDGWSVSRRCAPGYCGWELEAQRQIFNNFPDPPGIELTTGCLMIPEKSLSFACLLSSNGGGDAIKVGNCKLCEQAACPYRSPDVRSSAFRQPAKAETASTRAS